MVRNGHQSTTDTAASLAFLKALFEKTKNPINCCVLLNSDLGSKAGPQKTSRDLTTLETFIARNDIPKWGSYFCVSTMKSEKHRHAKDSIAGTPSLHADIDLKDITDKKDDVIRKFKKLKHPPSLIVDSGNGIHAYWQFKKAFVYSEERGARAEEIKRIEDALKLLCDLVGGDFKVCQPSAVMRLPGTHNSKFGEWKPVSVVEQNAKRYELDDLEKWLSETSPIILRKGQSSSKRAGDTNFWKEFAEQYKKLPVIDVEQRLSDMTYMGVGNTSIHTTQLSVTSSMAIAGHDDDEIVELVMKATFAAAGDYGLHWNRRDEEKGIRRMIVDARKKIATGRLGASSAAGDEQRTADGATVIDFAGKRDEKAQKEKDAKAKQAKEAAKSRRKEERSGYGLVGVDVLASLEQRGVRLLTTRDQLWRCDAGIWSLMDVGARQSMEVEIETACAKLKIPTDMKMIAEIRTWILRRPQLRHEKVEWDTHGKIPTRNGLIDPKTLKVEPLTPEAYATWCIDVEYDPKAKCPWWQKALLDMFADRPRNTRGEIINLLQEMEGAALLDNKPKALTKVLIMVGDSNSGKTTLIEVMSGLLSDNPIATSLETLGGTHGMMEFVRRAPWTLHEAFDGGKWHPSARIKQIISGDPIDINIKNGPIVTKRITQPIFWGSNLPVQIREPTNAVRNRVIIIDCRQEFKADELIGVAAEAVRLGFDKPHEFILKHEKAGLLNWALAGMKRVMNRGNFETVAEIEETLDEFRTESNLAASFLKECCTFARDNRLRVTDFCAAFSTHWIQNKSSDQPVPGNDAIIRAVKLYGDKRVVVGKDLRDMAHRFICGPHLNKTGLAYWVTAVTADHFRGSASRTSNTSTVVREVNQGIPPTWDKKELVRRLRKADFSPRGDEIIEE